jgi:hypothetical protein
MNLPNKYKNITLRQVYGLRKVIDGKDYSGNEVINYEGGIVFYDLMGGVSYDLKACKPIKSQKVKGVILVKGICEINLLKIIEKNITLRGANIDSVANIKKEITDKTKIKELIMNYTCITFEFITKW